MSLQSRIRSRVRRILSERQMSQVELAELMGISASQLSQVLNGHRRADTQADAFAAALDVDVVELVMPATSRGSS